MVLRIRNVVVVGKSHVSISILHALSHTSNDPIKCAKTSEASYDCDHHRSSLYNLTLLTRPHQSFPSTDHIHHWTVDYEPGSLTAAFQNADAVISAIAPADILFQKRLIDTAIAAHVPHFIPCEFSYDTQNPTIRDVFPPGAARAEILDYLKERSGQLKRFSWTALATGCSLESGLMDGLLAFDMIWNCATIYGTGDESFPCSTSRGLGEAMVQLLKELQEGRGEGEYFYRCEFITSQNEILEAIEGAEGKSWDVIKVEVDECVREGEMRMKRGFFDGAMMLLERQVLYGELGDMELWEKSKMLKSEEVKLDQVIKVVMDQVDRVGKFDCGCG